MADNEIKYQAHINGEEVLVQVRAINKNIEQSAKETSQKLENNAKKTGKTLVEQTKKTAKEISQSFQDEGGKVEKEAGKTSGKLAKMAVEAKDTIISKAKEATGITGNVFLDVGNAMLGVGKIAVDIGKKAVESAVNMDKAMNQFQASTGKSAEEMDRYQDVLEKIYANNYGKDFEEIANGMAQITKSMGNLPDEQLQSITESAFALRDTFQFDVNDSIDAASAMVKQFGIDGDQAMNLLAAGAQNGLDSSGELLGNITQYTEQFAKAGFSADDMFKIMQAGADSGAFSLETVAGALDKMSARIASGSGEAAEGFAALGLNADDMAAKFAAGGESAKEAFDQTMEALAGLEDPLAQSQAGTALFGEAWTDMGPDVVEQLANIQAGAYDTADAIGVIKEAKSDDLSSMFEKLQRQVELLLLPLGEALLPVLGKLLGACLPLVETLGNVLAPILEQFGEIIGVLMIPLTSLVDIIADILPPIIVALSSIMKNILGVAFEYIGNVIGNMKQVFQGIIDFITGAFTGNWEQAWNGIIDIFKGIFNLIPTIIEAILNGGIGIINGLIDGINFITGAIGIPPIPHIPNVQIPRLKIGLDYVPSDFFPAFLDEGERVLTKEENVRFNALGGLPGLEAALSGYGVAGASPSFAISLVGDVSMDGRRVGSVVLQNIDSVVRSNGG